MSVPWKTSLAESICECGEESASKQDDVDTQTSDSEHTWRRSGKHSWGKACKRTKQLEMISAPSTGRISSVPTSPPTYRMISPTARALEK